MATRQLLKDAFLAKPNKTTLTLCQLQQLAHATSCIQNEIIKVRYN